MTIPCMENGCNLIMEKVYISLGFGCQTAMSLIRCKKRNQSFPLDWTFSFHEIHKIFENDFIDFKKTMKYASGARFDGKKESSPDYYVEYNPQYSVVFAHIQKEEDIERRIERLLGLMKSGEKELVFIRRGHWPFWQERLKNRPLKQFSEVISDREDVEKLVLVLKSKYPNLKFKIHFFPVCNCGNNEEYDSEHLRIKKVVWSEKDERLDDEITLL